MTPADPTNGWVEYRRLVLAELARLADTVDETSRAVASLREELVALKVKSGMWGGISGLAAAVAAILVKVFIGK